MQRRNLILGGFAALGLGGWYLTRQTGQTSTALPSLASPANAESTAADVDTSGVVEMVLGNPDAPVTVTEYASFTCPHCADFHQGNFKRLKADYIDAGKIKFVYREVYFDRPGLWASMVARCGGPEKFFGISDLLYSGQKEWARAGGGDPAAIADELSKIGRLAGLEDETLQACMRDADQAQLLVAWFEQNLKADGIDSTPSFVIGETTYNNMPYEEMKKLIDAELGS